MEEIEGTSLGIGSMDGLKVFVNGLIPGERGLVEIIEKKKNYAKGKLRSLISPSPDRIEPLCPLAGVCGGCQIMHLKYEKQLEFKRDHVVQTLKRIGHIQDPPVEPCHPSPKQFGYRNKIQMPVENGRIGLFKQDSHEIVPVEKCYIHCEEGEGLLTTLKPLLTSLKDLRYLLIRNAIHSNEALVIFVTSGKESAHLKKIAETLLKKQPQVKGVIENINPRIDSNVILGNKWVTLAGKSYLFETLLGLKFKISAGAFFQVNTLQAEQLYTYALQMAEVEGKNVLDAYCGVGTLALLAAKNAKSVIGIECVKSAIDDAQENAELNKSTNSRFIAGNVENLIHTLPKPDVAILNPPRKGCDKKVLLSLSERKVERIVYISCDPATLARDCALLISQGYKLRSVKPFDMFPQTMHIESVAILDYPLLRHLS